MNIPEEAVEAAASNEPAVMRSKSTGAVTKVLPEFMQIYLEAGWVMEMEGKREVNAGMNIPDEVVEVAAEALVSSTLGDRGGIKWEEFFEAARQALNAAAPKLMAQALGVAADAIEEDPYDDLDPYYAEWLRGRAGKMLEAGE